MKLLSKAHCTIALHSGFFGKLGYSQKYGTLTVPEEISLLYAIIFQEVQG